MRLPGITFAFLSILCSVVPLLCEAQRVIPPSDTLHVKGFVEREMWFSSSQIGKLESDDLGSIIITNNKGEIKDTLRNVHGHALKDLLSQIVIPVEKPRYLNEVYFKLLATDGYMVLLSWNELFNSPCGSDLYLVTSSNGKKLTELQERIMLVCPSDVQTGRRYIKGLSEIVVGKLE